MYKFISVLLVMYLSDSSCVQVFYVLLVMCVDHDSGVLSESSCVQVYFCVTSDVC